MNTDKYELSLTIEELRVIFTGLAGIEHVCWDKKSVQSAKEKILQEIKKRECCND